MLVENVYELRERRRYINALFILYALVTLSDYLFDYHSVFFYIFIALLKIQEYSNERRLTVSSHQSVYLILDSLNTALELISEAALSQLFYDFF